MKRLVSLLSYLTTGPGCFPFLLIATIMTAASLLCGCSEQKKYRIGVSQCSQDDWRSKMNDEILREIILHDDAEVEIRSADDSNEKQKQDLQYFVDNDFDIIIVAPNEADALTPTVKKIYESGMPVIIFDRDINGNYYTSYIGVDNEHIGRSAARYARHLSGGKVSALEVMGRNGSTPAIDRHNGFASEMQSSGDDIVAGVTANWNQDKARSLTDSVLRRHPEINVIYAHNDRMAIGASEAARRLGRDSIRIIGIDAAPEIGIRAVADSIIDATFLYPTEGHRLVQTALRILKKEPFEREITLPASSAVDLSNADILLVQNETMKEEAGKIKVMKHKIDDFWEKHSAQTTLFYASIAILILLFCTSFLLLRSFWQHRRHQVTLMEQNRLLEEERDKQKELNRLLEEATQSKLVFFTNVSHDLRTPLTLIAEPVAQLRHATNLTPQQQSLMRIADKNVGILQRLINQILDFRKYENGKLSLNLAEIDFRSAMHDWVESFNTIARKRDIKLSLDGPADGDSPLFMALDSEKIERVVFNLVSNAFKYTPDNGTIRVSYGVEQSADTDKETLVLRVSDTGQGISERDMGNIFDRFFQVDRIHPKGSGIGLSLAKAFVELHGGSISVESELNKGSVFTVRIPVLHVAEEGTAHSRQITTEDANRELDNVAEDPAFDSDRPLALVIDDNPDIRTMVSELLGDDYNVITAHDGGDGIRKATKYVPDVIICDVMMPGMDGMECCRRMKSEVTTSHIPVLMLTACSLDEQRVQGFDSGADGYMAKPFSAAVLKAQCASLIANRRRIRNLSGTPNPQRETLPHTAKPDKVAPGNLDNDFYRRFLEIFNADMGNPDLSVDSLAANMGLERTQFYRKIKAITNYSPVELIRTLRLRRARTLLTSTDSSVSEIGYAVGFSTPAYFTKCYRTAYGETPSETRASLKEES